MSSLQNPVIYMEGRNKMEYSILPFVILGAGAIVVSIMIKGICDSIGGW